MNDENLKPLGSSSMSPQRAQEIRSMGGKACAEKRKQRKAMAESLREILEQEINPGGMTKQDAIALKVIKKIFDDPDIKDVKTLTEILGELKTNISTEGLAVNIMSSDKGKENIEKLMEE